MQNQAPSTQDIAMSLPSQDDKRAKNAITSPDVVPESPLQTTPHVWYPTPNQPHYTILLGEHNQREESSPYMVIARADNSHQEQEQQQGTIRFGASHQQHEQHRHDYYHQPSAAITPLYLLRDDDGEEEDNQLLNFLQQSPPNADHIFRPRTTSRRAANHGRREKRQESSSLSLKASRNTMFHSDNHREDAQRDACPSPWEPVPWKHILAAGPNMDGPERSAGTRRREAAVKEAEGENTKRASPLLIPRFGNSIPSNTDNSNILLPCPPSPLVRSNKKRPATTNPDKDDAIAGLLMTPESATALRLEAASDDSSLHIKKRAKHPTTSHAEKSPPAAWPSLLRRFWMYCNKQRPHLLETLINSVHECQNSAIQRDDDDGRNKDNGDEALSSAVMTVLVREWGGPLLGEVYRQVLAQQQEANAAVSAPQRDVGQPGKKQSKKSFADDTEMAIAYGMYLARQQQRPAATGAPASSSSDLQQAAQTFRSMTAGDRWCVWESLVDTENSASGTIE